MRCSGESIALPLRPCHVPGWVQSSGVRGAKALLWSTGLVLAPFHVVAARVPSAQELIDEFRDSQLILGDRHAAVTNSLRAVLEGSREASEMESDLQRFVEAVDEPLVAFRLRFPVAHLLPQSRVLLPEQRRVRLSDQRAWGPSLQVPGLLG